MKASYKEIIECLKDLIETQDFIIIPEFGALVMQMESAEFSIAQNVLFPPHKNITFNPLLKHNDGVLIAEIQKKLGIEYVLAQTMVQHFVQSLKVLLETKSRADIEGIGYFYRDIEGNVLFESQLNPFYLSESFGLSPISVIPISREKEEVFVSTEKASAKVIRFQHRNIYKAAVVLVIASLLFVYWWRNAGDIKNSWANLFGTRSAKMSIYVNTTRYPVIRNKYDRFELLKEAPIVNTTSEENNTSVENTIKSVDKKEVDNRIKGRFSVVVGCFKLEANAQRLFQQFAQKGIHASIKWNNEKQLYVVSIGQFTTKEAAVEELNRLKLKGILSDAWVKEEK
jgi:hypothetical protein